MGNNMVVLGNFPIDSKVTLLQSGQKDEAMF